MGHRDQARAGARPRRLSGVHPQGDDRPELRRLRAAIAGAAAADLSAIRHPQRADGRDHPRTGGRRTADSSSSACTAWARRCTRSLARIVPTSPAAPMRRSAATAICWPIWCGACWRTAPTRRSSRSPPTTPCRSQRCCGVRPTSSAAPTSARHPNIPSAARSLIGRSGRIRAGIEFGERAALNKLRRGDRRGDTPAAGKHRRCDTGRQRNAAIAAARDGFKALEPNAGRDAARDHAGTGRRPAGTARGAFHRAAAARGRQDAGRRAVGSPRGRRFLPLLRRARAAKLFGDGKAMPGPTGESNVLRLRGRGVFVAISPWNFPLAIFLGPGHGGADGRQRRGRKARRADAADRGRGRAAAA